MFRTRLLLVVLTGAAACHEPLQNGQVAVAPGVGERFEALCRWRGARSADSGCAAADSGEPARVGRIERDADKLEGPLALGQIGDYRLDNGEVVFVVDRLGPGSGFAESGGNVVDAADGQVRKDELGQVFTYFGAFPRQAVYDALKTGSDTDGAAWIEVKGHELYDERLKVTTRYTLAPKSRALSLVTTLRNDGTEGATIDLGDAVQWGSTEKVAPDKPAGFRGESAGSFLAGIGTDVAYILVPLSPSRGTAPSLVAKSGTAWSNAAVASAVTIPPGGSTRYERALVVARRGDALAVNTELAVLKGAPLGLLEVELADARGDVVRPAGRVTLAEACDAQCLRGSAGVALQPWLRVPAGAPVRVEIPAGEYPVGFEGDGRNAREGQLVRVGEGATAKLRLAVSEGGRLRVAVTEEGKAVPVKLQVFDAATGARVGDPKFATTGGLELGVAPGRYRVIATRGPEYDVAEAFADVPAGGAATAKLALRRVVDTSGYIACDFHQHSAHSADSGVSAALRVASNVVEGVECAVASEHNQVVDFGQVVGEMGLASFFRSIPGDEITSDASRAPFGHANAFPMPVRADRPRGGAIPVRDRSPKDVFADVRAIPGERVLQVNHPRSGKNGYFDLLVFDREKGEGTVPGYDPAFDAIEVWSGRHAVERGRVLDDFWALVRTSHPVTPTANTDTHGIVLQEAGYPRTYVRVDADDPARLDVASLVKGVRERRDVVITNGPFVTARLGGIGPGGLVSLRANAPPAELRVRVERAAWVDASELEIVVDGLVVTTIRLPGTTTTPLGARVDEVVASFRVEKGKLKQAPRKVGGAIVIAQDTAVAVVVTGKRPLEPVLAGDPAEILPFAMTSPIWVDADGDGRALGR